MSSLVDALPVLLDVIELLDIPTLLSLRHTCRSFHHLITAYESSIVKRQWENGRDRYDNTFCRIKKPETLKDLGRLDSAYHLAGIILNLDQSHTHDWVFVKQRQRELEKQPRILRANITEGLLFFHQLSVLANRAASDDRNVPSIKMRLSWAKAHLLGRRQPTLREKAIEEKVRVACRIHRSSPAGPAKYPVTTEWYMRGGMRMNRYGRMAPMWKRLSDAGFKGRHQAVYCWVAILLRKGPGFLVRLWSEDAVTATAAESEVMAQILNKSPELIMLEFESHLKNFGTSDFYMKALTSTRDFQEDRT